MNKQSEIADKICKLIDKRTDLISLNCFERTDEREIEIIDLNVEIEGLQCELYYT